MRAVGSRVSAAGMDAFSDSDFDFELQGPFESVNPASDGNCSLSNTGTTIHDRGREPSAGAPLSKTAINVSKDNTSVSKVQQDLFQKIGENSILRSRLESIETEHQKTISDLINYQNKVREDQKHELEEFKRRLQRERNQHEFQIRELKAKGMIGSGSERNRPTPSYPSISGNNKSGSEYTRSQIRRKPEEPFSDGFVLKKPRLDLTPTPVQVAPQLAKRTRSGHENEQHILLPFLVAHKAPGFTGSTLQLLYEVPTHVNGLSMGRDFAMSTTRDELLLKILSFIDLHHTNFSSDITALLLSLLYDALFLPTVLRTMTLAEAPRMLAGVLLAWLQASHPLPSLMQVEKIGMLQLVPARRFIAILYALDALIAMDWDFELPSDICRLAFSRQDSPQLYIRACDLIAKHPSAAMATILVREVPRVVVTNSETTLPRLLPEAVVPGGAATTTEMLFSGLSDGGKLSGSHTVVEFAQGLPSDAAYFRFVKKVADFEKFIHQAAKKSDEFVFAAQCAWIRAVQANVELLRDNASSQTDNLEVDMDRGVLNLLSCGLDAAQFWESPVVRLAVMYFWCREVDALRESMASHNMTELCVCLTIIVYANNSKHNIIGQAQDILRDLTSLEEIEHFYDAFRTRDEWDEANYTLEHYSQEVDRMEDI